MKVTIPPRSKFFSDYLTPGILAGIAIGIGSIVNLKYPGIIGAIFFAFGLTTIAYQQWVLFTGRIGMVNLKTPASWLYLPSVILLNAIGVGMIALICKFCYPEVIPQADSIVNSRISMGWLKAGLAAIPCGFIMTWAVYSTKDKQSNYLPLLLGIPLFILCGFPHCIADVSYYIISNIDCISILYIWIATIIGNSIGARIHLCLF